MELRLPEDAGLSAMSLLRDLQESRPSIQANPSRVREGILISPPPMPQA